jgi:class 3 adenylate cyclase
LLLNPDHTSLHGKGIQEIFPELIGYEHVLEELHLDKENTLQIDRIFRPSLHGKAGYVSLHVKAFASGWLIGVRNTTSRGEMEQKIVQHRNELSILAAELELARAKSDTLLRAFVPPAVVDDLLRLEETARLGGEKRLVTVLFADLRGYTAWAEKSSPEKALLELNKALTFAVDILSEHHATVNQLMGDGFMSIFNAPIEQPDHAALALECAKRIASLPGLGQGVQFGVGVNTGVAMVGNVGSPRVMDYSAIGTTTNIAYRFQQLAGPGKVLFGDETRKSANIQFPFRDFGTAQIKGITDPIQVYELIPG